MSKTLDVRSALAKAARIVLVFALVFYTSLRVELFVAFGAEGDFDEVTAVSDVPADGDKLVDVLIYQRVVNAEDGKVSWQPIPNARATTDGEAELELLTDGGACYLVAMPVWKSNKDDVIAKFKDGKSLTSIESASFTEFKLGNDDCATLSTQKKNVQVITPKADGTVTVKCTVDADFAKEYASDNMQQHLSFTFKTVVKTPEPPAPEVPAVKSVDVLDSAGAAIPESGLTLDMPVKDYQLQAGVTFDSGAYNYPADGNLSKFSDQLADNLAWSIDPADGGAAIDPATGVLNVTEAGEFTVTCSVPDKDGNVLMSQKAKVVVNKEKEDGEGDEGEDGEGDGKGGEGDEGGDGKDSEISDEDVQLLVTLTCEGIVDGKATRSQGGEYPSYPFVAHVEASGAMEFDYTSTDGAKLSDASKPSEDAEPLFSDLEWMLTDEEGNEADAAIVKIDSATGVLEVVDADAIEGKTYNVICKTTGKSSGVRMFGPLPVTFSTEEGEKADDGGSDESKAVVGAEVWLTGSNPALEKGTPSITIKRNSESDSFPEYQFTGHVRVYETTSDGETVDILEYSTNEGSLADKTKDSNEVKLQDVEWVLRDRDNNVIDDGNVATLKDGLLKVSQDGTYQVFCRVAAQEGTDTWDGTVIVTYETVEESEAAPTEEENDPDRSQNELRVVANVPDTAVSDEALKKLEEASKKSSSNDNASDSSSSSSTESSSSSSSSEASESSESSSSTSSETKVVALDETFSLSDMESLKAEKETFSMVSSTRNLVEVMGEGPTLESLLKKLGITDMSVVKSVKFVSYADLGTGPIDWSTLASGSKAPMVALKSNYLSKKSSNATSSTSSSSTSSEESTASTSSEASADSQQDSDETPELIPNDRFHVLYDMGTSSKIDADDLRYIKEIIVNPDDTPTPDDAEEKKEGSDAPFSVSIDAAWAPINENAVLTPVPSLELEGTFDYLWEESSDDGKTWKEVYDSQTYRVKVTKKNIGNQVRVTVHSSMKDPETDKEYDATSEPKKLQIEEGFIAQLEYDPPQAGDVALFQVRIIDSVGDVDKNKLDYIWEMSEDGQKTWKKLSSSFQGNSTLRIKTTEIDEDDASASDAKLIYIRCTVVETSGQKRSRTTNSQGFTVQAKNAKATKKDSDKPKGGNDSKNDSGKKNPVDEVDEFDDINDEESDDTTPTEKTKRTDPEKPKTPEKPKDVPVEDKPKDYQPIDMTQVQIDGKVTEQILKQEEAVQEQFESTVPGARWTKLSAAQGDEDTDNVLGDNPFAPLAIPTGLGITIAGGLEKLLAFRRQI